MVLGMGSASPRGSSSPSLEAAIRRLEAVADRLEGAAGGAMGAAGGGPRSAGAGAGASLPSSTSPLADWDARVAPAVAALVEAAASLDKEVKAVTDTAAAAFTAGRGVLATIVATPAAPADLTALLSPVSAHIAAAEGAASGRRGPAFHHAKAVADLLPALLWPAAAAPPSSASQHVDDAWQAAEFWANKAAAEAKADAKAAHLAWVRALKACAGALRDHVGACAVGGPAWGVGGGGGGAAAPAPAPSRPARGGPPPPPPPLPAGGPGCLARDAAASAPAPGPPAAKAGGGGMAAVLAAIAGGAGGGGLRKVDRKAAAAAAAAAPVPAPAPRGAPTTTTTATTASAPPKGPPRTALEPGGRKWVIENYTPEAAGGAPITLDKATPAQAVAITACDGVTVDVRGKVNAVCVDGCARVGLRLGSVVSSVELVNGSKLGVEVTGTAPTVAVDGCRGVTLYLSPGAAASTDVTTAQSSEVNIVLAGGGGAADADPVELAVPEQFVSRVVDGRLVTAPVAHSGA